MDEIPLQNMQQVDREVDQPEPEIQHLEQNEPEIQNIQQNIQQNRQQNNNNGQMRARITNVQPTHIVIKDLDYSIGEKPILKKMNMAFTPGRLSVIVGPSGSGKTTLLSLMAGLSGTIPSKSKTTGDILMNGSIVDSEKIRKIVGFVFQEDVILETMTVEEAINLSIRLRVGDMTDMQIRALLDRMISVSQLDKARKVKIGSPLKKGISGGERKRTAIAMELVSNPSVLLLDEPTSGLDTYTAYRIIALLKRLAHQHGRTVVATLHQPSSEIFHMIDDLFVLNDGEIVYGGPGKHMVRYFTDLGYKFPEYSNPLDVLFMDILNKSKEDEFSEYLTKSATNESSIPLEDLARYYRDSTLYKTFVMVYIKKPPGDGVTKEMHRFRAKALISFWYLFARDLKNVLRNPMIVKTKMFQTLFLAVFVAIVFMNTGSSPVPALYQNVAGLLFFLVTNAFFASFQNVLPVFSSEKPSFSREHSQGYYPMTSYFLAKISVELPLTFFFPILTAVIVYWATGLRAGIGFFFQFLVILQLVSLAGFSFGLLAACIFNDLSVALALSILILLPFMIFSGLFLNVNTVPVWLRWIQWVSPMRYGYSALMENQFRNWNSPGAQQFYVNSGISTGIPYIGNILILGGLFILALFAAYLALARVVLKNEGRGVVKSLTSLVPKQKKSPLFIQQMRNDGNNGNNGNIGNNGDAGNVLREIDVRQ